MKKVSIIVIICLVLSVSIILMSNIDKLKQTEENILTTENKITEVVNNQIIEVFYADKDIFERTSELMQDCRGNSVIVSYDRKNGALLSSIDNEIISIDNLFDESAQELILSCFAEMSKVSAEEVNLVISKLSPEVNNSVNSESINFKFRAKSDSEYADYGITFCRDIGDSNYKKIEENWYWFEFGLV